MENIRIFDSGYAFILDEDSNVIYHPETDSEQLDLETTAINDADEFIGTNHISYTYQGVRKEAVWIPLSNGMQLYVAAPVSEIDSGWTFMVWNILLAALVIVAASIVFMLWFSGRITKPYPDIEIVKARIAKCIELSEDRELIRYTERDKLTGLLNKDYFYRYVGRLDHLYKDSVLDAVVFDVNRFHSANKQYGRQFGDQVLRSIGNGIKKLAREVGGIGCRQGGDIFLLYCPHQDGYEEIFRAFASAVFADEEIKDKVSLRFGVYVDARRETDVEERFTRAKIAADRVKDDPQNICGYYDLD